GIDRLLQDLLGMLGGDLFDLHAALGRRHHGHAPRAAVDHHADVELARDVDALLDEEALHALALGPGLMGHEVHAVDGARLLLGVDEVLGDLDAAALAAAAGVDLRFDDDDVAPGFLLDFADCAVDFAEIHDGTADGDGDAVALEQLLALILVNLHGLSPPRQPRNTRRARGTSRLSYDDGDARLVSAGAGSARRSRRRLDAG